MNLGAAPATGGQSGLTELVGGVPPWPELDHGSDAFYPPVDGDVTGEVVVLGAGLTGALCASLLLDAGLDVMVLDKHRVAGGSTSANTGLLLYEPDQPLHRLEGMLGTEGAAAAAYRLCYRAIDAVAALAERLASAHFTWRPSLILASRPEHVESLRREYEARLRLGYPTTWLERREVESAYAFSFPAALRGNHAAQIDPYGFARALIAEGAARGLRVHERTEVVAYRADGDYATLTTDRGYRVRARHVIFATGYETERYLLRRLARDNTTFAVLTEPLDRVPGWPDQAVIWETARPYLYLRTTVDGRILIGGLDEPLVDSARRDAALPEKRRQLLEHLRRMLPETEPQIAYAWAGTFLNTDDSLPYIGRLPGLPHAWFALAFGGNGITFGMLAAELLRDAILGRPREDAHLFRFDRTTARDRRK